MSKKTSLPKFDHKPDILTFPYSVEESAIAFKMVFEGEPVSKGRARFNRNGNAYTPEKTRNYEAHLRMLMRLQLGAQEADADSTFALRCLFFRSTRQRIDCDNLIKAVSDAANGQIWRDDAQIMEVFGRLYLFETTPRVEVLVYRLENSAPRTSCLQCGKPVKTYPSVNSQYCSTACANRSTHVVCTCKECGKEFDIPKSLAAKRAGFCSRECGIANHAKRRRATGRDLWRCTDCGEPVSRKEYTRCRACSMKHRQEPTSNYWKLRYGKGEAA